MNRNKYINADKYYKKFDKIDYLIIEQSSFQLHNLSLYKPYISILLNLSENHLDDSYSLTTYYENKKNIYKYQTSKEYFILDSSNFKNKQLDTDATIIDLLKYPYILYNLWHLSATPSSNRHQAILK